MVLTGWELAANDAQHVLKFFEIDQTIVVFVAEIDELEEMVGQVGFHRSLRLRLSAWNKKELHARCTHSISNGIDGP